MQMPVMDSSLLTLMCIDSYCLDSKFCSTTYDTSCDFSTIGSHQLFKWWIFHKDSLMGIPSRRWGMKRFNGSSGSCWSMISQGINHHWGCPKRFHGWRSHRGGITLTRGPMGSTTDCRTEHDDDQLWGSCYVYSLVEASLHVLAFFFLIWEVCH